MDEKSKYINDLKSFVNESKFQLVSLMEDFGFLSNQQVDISTGHQFNLKSMIYSLQEHTARSEACISPNIDHRLPSPIPKSLLPDRKLVYNIDEETRYNLLESLRDNEVLKSSSLSIVYPFKLYILCRFVICTSKCIFIL